MTFYIGKNTRLADFRAPVGAMSENTFASPRRSTVALLDFWREPEKRLADLSRELRLPNIVDASLHFEYPVAVKAGRGKPSFTDLMIIGGDVAIAIEAKHREPIYASCADWLGDADEESNRSRVLLGWIDFINERAGSSLAYESIATLPYQLIHRTASVFSLGASQRFLVYQIFDESQQKASFPDINKFRDLIGDNAGFHVAIMRCPFQPTPLFAETVKRWDDRQSPLNLSSEVRHALMDGPVFTFSEPSVQVDNDSIRS